MPRRSKTVENDAALIRDHVHAKKALETATGAEATSRAALRDRLDRSGGTLQIKGVGFAAFKPSTMPGRWDRDRLRALISEGTIEADIYTAGESYYQITASLEPKTP